LTPAPPPGRLCDMRDEDRSQAQDAFIMGDLLARQGDVESARGAFQSAIAMRDPEWSPRAAYHLGELLWAARDPDGAEAALGVTPQRQRCRRRARLPNALERRRPLDLVHQTRSSATGRPGHLPSRPGSHRHPITTQPPDPTGNATALPAPWAAALRALPAVPTGPVDPRRGLLPLPLPRRVRRRFRLPIPKVGLST
jgi:hypothetical protein